MIKNNTEFKGYILGAITLGKELTNKNREASKKLAAANERIKTIPNHIIMFNQIILMESKGSSAIENVLTTNDELYKEIINKSPKENNASKSLRIKSAVKYISKTITNNQIVLDRDIKYLGEIINGHKAGYRPQPGTKITNDQTKEVVHIPPQTHQEVLEHIKTLISYINNGGENDPITDALLIHHAFEWIHPFIDGNGRTGRVLMAAYMQLHKEIDNIFLPISYFINQRRSVYYEALKRMTNDLDYEFYLEKMYEFVVESAEFTIKFARKYDKNRNTVRQLLMDEFGKYFEAELIDTLFYNAYSTPKLLTKYSGLNYRTIEKIIAFLVKKDVFLIKKEGKNKYYINQFITKEVL